MTDHKNMQSRVEISVVGLGRIGLPLALVAADSGYVVHGIDANPEVIRNLAAGKPLFSEPEMDILLRKHLHTRFLPTTDDAPLVTSAFIVVTVSTGVIDQPGSVNLEGLEGLMRSIARKDLRGKTIILRSTVPIGTTDRCKDLLESESGLHCGSDFHIGYCPERVVEGAAVREERTLPKVIGAYDDAGFTSIASFFQPIGGEIIRVSSPRTAELVKLANNAYRSTLFGFANDLATLADTIGVDVLEAISAANANYPRSHIPRPSCGVSGYCLTKDPYILEDAFEPVASARGFRSVWYYARMTNDWMPRYAVHLALEELAAIGKGTGPSRVLVAGVTFKEDVDDVRYSHGVAIVRSLLAERPEFRIGIYDPFIETGTDAPYHGLPPDLCGKVEIFNSFGDALRSQDAVIFTVPHREFVESHPSEWAGSLALPAVVIDGWNIYHRKMFPSTIRYRGIGHA